MTPHSSIRPCGSSPVVGSSRNSTGGRCMSAAARSSRRRIPPEYVRTTRSAASMSAKCSSSSWPRGAMSADVHVRELPDHLEVLATGEVLVDGGRLAGETDRAAHPVRVLGDVDPEHLADALVGQQQRGEDAHRRGLARAVRPEQPEHATDGDLERHTAERGEVAEALDQTRRLESRSVLRSRLANDLGHARAHELRPRRGAAWRRRATSPRRRAPPTCGSGRRRDARGRREPRRRHPPSRRPSFRTWQRARGTPACPSVRARRRARRRPAATAPPTALRRAPGRTPSSRRT